MMPVRNESSISGPSSRTESRLDSEAKSNGASAEFDAALAAHEEPTAESAGDKQSQKERPEAASLPLGAAALLMPAQGLATLASLFAQPRQITQGASEPVAQDAVMVASACPPSVEDASALPFLKESALFKGEMDAGEAAPDALVGPKGVLSTQASLFPAAEPSSQEIDLAAESLATVPMDELRSEKHFPPVQADPVRQIATSVVKALKEVEAPPAAPASLQMHDAPIKTLQIRLEPEDLGSVTLRMRLSGNQLSLRVDVAEATTLHLIQREQDRLHKSLARDDVQIEKLEIRAAASVTDSAPLARSEEAARQGTGSGLRGEGQSSQLSQGQQQRAKGETPRRESQETYGLDETSSLAPRGAVSSGLYL